jgi:hypothetical protein
MASIKAWKYGDPTTPFFPDEFEIVEKAVLQVTDIKNNNNKYYAIELHSATHGGKTHFRVFTHYGRTDDLESNPNAGQKEVRILHNQYEAEGCYRSIYAEKTSPRKGYKELSLASSKIGSQKARGTSSGDVDAKTIQKIAEAKAKAGEPVPVVKKSDLHGRVQDLVGYIYEAATTALTTTVAAKITANGIETPLGILTVGQIEKGEEILQDLYALFKKGSKNRAEMERLSGHFYTAIPHRIGRTRDAIQDAVIDDMKDFQVKQETLQLMKDMLQVNGEGGSVLFDSQVDAKYDALKCGIGWVEPGTDTYNEIEQHVLKSQIKIKNIKVQNVFTLKRAGEYDGFRDAVGNHKLLFHGSSIKNWVGILSRGLLMPKIVVSMGGSRTDEGWLGNGIYFGDASCTSAFYTGMPGKKGTRFMSVARVALGRMKDYHKITYGLTAPPAGYDSCHGVRARSGVNSEFADDEYVIYTQQQQRLEYLVEFKM